VQRERVAVILVQETPTAIPYATKWSSLCAIALILRAQASWWPAGFPLARAQHLSQSLTQPCNRRLPLRATRTSPMCASTTPEIYQLWSVFYLSSWPDGRFRFPRRHIWSATKAQVWGVRARHSKQKRNQEG
jgi:hypothetical protein